MLERVGTIAKVEVLRDQEDVYISVLGRVPTLDESFARSQAAGALPRNWRKSPGNRWACLSPAQARRIAYRLIDAAAKVDRKEDRLRLWTEKK